MEKRKVSMLNHYYTSIREGKAKNFKLDLLNYTSDGKGGAILEKQTAYYLCFENSIPILFFVKKPVLIAEFAVWSLDLYSHHQAINHKNEALMCIKLGSWFNLKRAKIIMAKCVLKEVLKLVRNNKNLLKKAS